MTTTSATQMTMPAWSGTGADVQFEGQEHGSFDYMDPFLSSQLFNAGMHLGTQFNSQQSIAPDAPQQYMPFSSPNLSLVADGAETTTEFPVLSPYMTPNDASIGNRTYAASSGNLNLNTNAGFGSPYGVSTTRAASAQPMLGTTLLPLATGNLGEIQHMTSARSSHSLNTTPMRQRLHSHPIDRQNLPPLSPTVTIEECEGPTALPSLSRHHSRRSHTSTQSRTHLSPFDPVDRFDADDEGSLHHLSSPVISQQGNYDGQNTFDAQDSQPSRGIAPSMRGDQEIASLDDQSRVRRLSEKNQDVEDWLSASDVGSDIEGSKSRRKQSGGIRRSRAPARRPNAQSSSSSGSIPAPIQASIAVDNSHGRPVELPSTTTFDRTMDAHFDTGSPAADLSAMNLNSQLEDNSMASSCNSRPWIDPEPALRFDGSTDQRCQPLTANAAMARFVRRAKETDNASLAATLASSRRKSESDMGSLFNAPLTSDPFIPGQTPLTQAALQRRGRGIFAGLRGNMIDNATSKLKRKISNKTQQRADTVEGLVVNTYPVALGSESTTLQYTQNVNSSLTLNTNVDATNPEARSPKVGVIQTVRQSLSRNRSSSNLARSPRATSGLVAMWQQTGGPPVARLGAGRMPNPVVMTTPDVRTGGNESGEEMEQGEDSQAMDLSVRSDVYLHPSSDGFGYHTTQLNPDVQSYLLARVVDEQTKRYERLIRMASEHAQRVDCGSCPSKQLCRSMGVNYKLLEPKQLGGHADSISAIFHVTQAGQTLDPSGEEQTVPATFPVGIPLPPVPRLPARFECPFCFQVKDFHKPSDWTKHVHEDVQPFTCTFSNCNEPKSFKRKADWVRHESERHRQLESWTCNMSSDCQHVCHRKDNFVQHLVREHKVPEPKVRTGRTQPARSPQRPEGTLMMTADEVWTLVDSCKSEATKDARMEPCRFCGLVCANYKKLTVHLAKHLEQISLPIITQLEYGMTSTAFPNREQPMFTTAQAMADPSGGITASPVTVMGGFATDPFGVYSGNTTTAATYPPTYAAVQQASMQFSQGLSPSSPYFGASTNLRQPLFPAPGRQRSVSFNGQASPGMLSQGSTYPPVSLPTQTADAPSLQQEYSIPWQQTVPQGFYQGVSPGGSPFLAPNQSGGIAGGFGQQPSSRP